MAPKIDPKELKKAKAELKKILSSMEKSAAPLKAEIKKYTKNESKISSAEKSLLKTTKILEGDDDLDKD